jgi:hypothetical protein
MIMWGVNTGNKAIRDLGIFLYETEARAIEQYWWDVDNAVFPATFTHTAVGQVWTDGGQYTTWFSGDPSAIQGINILPITPGHMYIGRRPDYIPKNYAEGNTGGWSDLFDEYLAFSDPASALQKYNAGTGIEPGNSQALCYHVISSLNTVGKLDTEVTADIPTFAVFDKGTIRTYNAYNPDPAPKTVTFNDGFSMVVPARKQIHRTGTVKPVSTITPVMQSHPRMISLRTVVVSGGRLSLPTLTAATGTLALYSLSGKKMWESGVCAGKLQTAGPRISNGLYIVKQYR